MKVHTIEEVMDRVVGNVGTPDRDKFEYDLQMDLIGKAIKHARLEQNMTQEELGKLIGVGANQVGSLLARLVSCQTFFVFMYVIQLG